MPSNRDSWTADDIVRANPDARKINDYTVRVQPGILVLLPHKSAINHGLQVLSPNASGFPYDGCPYLNLCFWENSWTDPNGPGYGIGIEQCQGGTNFIDLGHESYPDFRVTNSPPTWNDRISSYVNNQTNGTLAWFLNYYTSAGWLRVRNSTAPDYYLDLSQIGINDIIDGVHVC